MKITVVGNIGKDAVVRKVGEAEHQFSVCDIWIAENIKKRDGTKKTLWHKVTIWRNYADTMAPYLKAGRKVLVTGTAEAACYTTQDQRLNPYIKIQADEITLMDSAPQEEAPVEAESEEETPWD